MQRSAHHRSLLKLPVFAALPRTARDAFRDADQIAIKMGSSGVQALACWKKLADDKNAHAWIDRLSHSLSPIWIARQENKPPVPHRSEREWTVLRVLREDWAPPSTSGLTRSLGRRLGAANAMLTRSDGLFRSCSMFSAEDASGHHVVFPPPREIESQLSRLEEFLAGEDPDAPLTFKAAVALVTVLNCHPFPDGNGRTARLLFNLILNWQRLFLESYIPLYEIFFLSKGGFLLRMRKAEIEGDWVELSHYFFDLFEFIRAAASDS